MKSSFTATMALLVAVSLENAAYALAAAFLVTAGVCFFIVNSRLDDLSERLDSVEKRVPKPHDEG